MAQQCPLQLLCCRETPGTLCGIPQAWEEAPGTKQPRSGRVRSPKSSRTRLMGVPWNWAAQTQPGLHAFAPHQFPLCPVPLLLDLLPPLLVLEAPHRQRLHQEGETNS